MPAHCRQLFYALVLVMHVVTYCIPVRYADANELYNLPRPGTMVLPTPNFLPPLIKGITVHPENPLQFDFIIHNGERDIGGITLEQESLKQIKYFLAAMTIPEERMWVNLSPFENDRIISDDFGATEMGKDLLMQDYILKQLTASLIYPEDEIGKKFWERTYKRAYELLGTTDIPINTFNKIWIVPDKAVVYERDNTVFVLESRLKVMLEEDYLASKSELYQERYGQPIEEESGVQRLSAETAQIVREVLIPEIEREVNEGETFIELRQIYQSMILAAWYKTHLRQSLLGQVYADKSKTDGVNVDDPLINRRIYAQYLTAYEKGVYNIVQDEYDPMTQEMTQRTYFSGGINTAMMSGEVLEVVDFATSLAAQNDFASLSRENEKLDLIVVELEETSSQNLLSNITEQGMASGFSGQAISINPEAEVTEELARQIEESMATMPYAWVLSGYVGALMSRSEMIARESSRDYLIGRGISPQVVTQQGNEIARDNEPEMARIGSLLSTIRAEITKRKIERPTEIARANTTDIALQNRTTPSPAQEPETGQLDLFEDIEAGSDQAMNSALTNISRRLDALYRVRAGEIIYSEDLLPMINDTVEFERREGVGIEALKLIEDFINVGSHNVQSANPAINRIASLRDQIQRERVSSGFYLDRNRATPVGGIDFDPTLLDLQIKRDGQGIALPAAQQDLSQVKIDGLYPVIVSIMPVVDLPVQLGELSPAAQTASIDPSI